MLNNNPGLKIQVYAIWFSMLRTDDPKMFASARHTMPDRRVTHYWDSQKDAGRWFKQTVPSDYEGQIQWDAFYLYGTAAEWTEQPSPLVATGRTILEDRRKLAEALESLRGAR